MQFLTKDTPYLAREGKIWGVFCETSDAYLAFSYHTENHIMLDRAITAGSRYYTQL